MVFPNIIHYLEKYCLKVRYEEKNLLLDYQGIEKHRLVLEQISPNKWGSTFPLLSSFMTWDFSAAFPLRSRF